MDEKNRLGFVTCVQLGLECMQAIYDWGAELDLVVTLDDGVSKSKSGRVYVDGFCGARNIQLLKTRSVNDKKVIAAVQDREIDWLFIIGWSQIAKSGILNSARLGCIGIHPTLLPQGRGRAAIPWAILKGLRKTGVTLFRLDEGVDTGPIIDQKEILIDDFTTATDLYGDVRRAHYDILKQSLGALIDGSVTLREQDHSKASIWEGRRPEDGRLSEAMTMGEALLMIRAVTRPYPGAFFVREGKIVRIWAASLEPREGSLKIGLSDGVVYATDFQIECA